jgi:hypothetical protein
MLVDTPSLRAWATLRIERNGALALCMEYIVMPTKALIVRSIIVAIFVILTVVTGCQISTNSIDELQRSCPLTSVYFANCSNDAVRTCSFQCRSMPHPERSTTSGPCLSVAFDAKPKLIWHQRWPDPIVIKDVVVTLKNGQIVARDLNFVCLPGQQLLIELSNENKIVATLLEESPPPAAPQP